MWGDAWGPYGKGGGGGWGAWGKGDAWGDGWGNFAKGGKGKGGGAKDKGGEYWKCENCGFFNKPANAVCGGNGPLGCKLPWGSPPDPSRPPKPAEPEYKPKSPGEMPDIVMLELPDDSKLLATGLCSTKKVLVIEWEKLDIFSESHYFLQNLCGDQDVREVCPLEYAAVDEDYPEILKSWKAIGKYDTFPTVAKCEQMACCAIGMGSKKNGERAAKLAVSLVMARALQSVAPAHVAEVCSNYPAFMKFLDYANALPQLNEA